MAHNGVAGAGHNSSHTLLLCIATFIEGENVITEVLWLNYLLSGYPIGPLIRGYSVGGYPVGGYSIGSYSTGGYSFGGCSMRGYSIGRFDIDSKCCTASPLYMR